MSLFALWAVRGFPRGMCNHYRPGQKKWIRVDAERLAARAGKLITLPLELPEMTEQVFPKGLAPIILQTGGDAQLVAKTWGVPLTIKGAKGQPLIKAVANARNDKLGSYPWRYSTQERRCLIPATGYFEPGLGPAGIKGEILFTVKGRPEFFLAGLWEGDTFTMVTTEPNEFVRQFHDRMPVVLSDEDARAWLGESPLPADELQRLCRGLPTDALDHETLPPKLKITRIGTKGSSDPATADF